MPARVTVGCWRRLAAPLLGLLGLAAGWSAAALLYALLWTPADTMAILDARGSRGLPAVVWAGSLELIHLVRPEGGHPLSTFDRAAR